MQCVFGGVYKCNANDAEIMEERISLNFKVIFERTVKTP